MKFEIQQEKEASINNWIKTHRCKYKNKPTAIGGRISYIFTPTGIGVFAIAKCICGKEFTIEDGSDF